ncbi:hypothetical protein LTR36_005904 [Oleoguttula mirabilis]|uniref:Methyltransferase domain-containing protein n=1 Tax=Oleoguttula mirabilis TaxID=1507867 RepID=A0AAV9JED9_9PEZI|nr:hypothetical protein LTR36_005904 [Oleoguttula mirabilis]
MAAPSIRHQANDAQNLFDNRASRYDDSWHPRFARHMVELAQLRPGEHVLDLACGTGLVSYPASSAVGPAGTVMGVDISSGMLAQAKAKWSSDAHNNVEFHQHSITGLDSLPELKGKRFDVIICASALVLLEHPAEALKQWVSYLEPGGRLITDVTHPQSQLPFIAFERVGHALGKPVPYYRTSFRGPNDLRFIMEAAGLQVADVDLVSQMDIDGKDDLQSYLQDSDNPRIERTFDVEDADAMFDQNIDTWPMTDLAVPGLKLQARKLFEEEWAKLADATGKIREVDGVFVGIGRKPQ